MNIYTVCFILSILILLSGILLSKFAQRAFHKYNYNITRYVVIYIALALALFTAVLPLMESPALIGKWFFSPLLETVRVLTATLEIPEFDSTDSLIATPLYTVYLSFLYILAPVMTIGFLIRIFTNLFSSIKFYLHSRDLTYAFSDLNEQTLILGKDIYKKLGSKQVLIVYFDPPSKSETGDWLKQEAKAIDAIIFPQHISEFNFGRRKGELNIILNSSSEVENISEATQLIDENRLKNCKKTDIYLFITVDEYDLIIDSYMQENKDRMGKKIRIICIDDLHNITSGLFCNEPLYKNLKKGETIKLMIFGDTHLAIEFIKEASWTGQMITHGLEIISASLKPENVKKQIREVCPELEKEVLIKYISSKDVDLKKYRPTYIIIALEDELEVLKEGVKLSAYYYKEELLENSKKPIICLWNGSSRLRDQILKLKDGEENPYDLIPFGSLKDRFSSENIFNSKLDELGRKANKIIGGSDTLYYSSEYIRKSSCAIVLHNQYKIHDLKLILESGTEDLMSLPENKRQELFLKFYQLEHKRWCTYLRSIGYSNLPLVDLTALLKSGKIKKPVLNKARLHSYLVRWDNKEILFKNNTYNNLTLTQINKLLGDDRIDELDRVALTCWKLMKEDLMEENEAFTENPKCRYENIFEIINLGEDTNLIISD